MFTHLDPKFVNCTAIVWNQLVLDPPIPLTTANALVPEASAPVTTTNTDPESVPTPAAPVTETSAPFAPSTVPAGSPATATTGSDHSAGGSTSSQPADAAGPQSSGPSSEGSTVNSPSSTGAADPADSNPWDNLGSMISGLWGVQPTASDPASANPASTASTAGQTGESADPPSNNDGGIQQQQPQPSTGLPAVETAAPEGNSNDGSTLQATAVVPVIVTIGTALASPVPAAGPSADPDGNGVAIGTQTLAPGSTTLIASHTVVAAPSGGAVVVDGSTSLLHTSGPAVLASAPIATAGLSGTIIIDPANPSGVLLGDQPLAPGATTTVDGVQVVVPTSGGAVVVGGETHAFHTASSSSAISGIAVVPVDPQDPSKGVIIGGSDDATLTPGASTTVDGTEIAMPATIGGGGNGVVVIDEHTYDVPSPPLTNVATAGQVQSQTTVPFSPVTNSAGIATAAIILVANGEETLTVTSIAPGTVVLGGPTTLSVGGAAATIHGSVVSAAPDGLVVADAGGLGSLIAAGLGGAVGSVTTSAGATTAVSHDSSENVTTPTTWSTTPFSGSMVTTSTMMGTIGEATPISRVDTSATGKAAATTTAASAAGLATGPFSVARLLSFFIVISVIPLISSAVL
ncbi:hypothetical protein MPH_01262 [Macrophomina phaseolina MS6]|uniref:Uncharacterized protein n=1 Tax=Macrophomina phaseolina (strain MS6) TaxID=1126212 RepID=K2S373_MACPH|nr:hypothetical protein MPH_01262 [Macrophomina phaseolina MS6]